jgi:alkanesulfonate monooxygenase SsuD/methylene tetrahydromethanopterin reductase-like flavin-dependent oxidoreductase (luciferase family)
LKLEKPATRMRETVTLLKSMLAGDKTDFSGETLRSAGYRQPALATRVPVHLAALGPRMIELAASVADGVILNLFPLSATHDLVGQARDAATRAGRHPDEIEICSRFQVWSPTTCQQRAPRSGMCSHRITPTRCTTGPW